MATPLSAERFRYAITRTCDPLLDSFTASLLFIIAGCEAFFTSLEPADYKGYRTITDLEAFSGDPIL